MSKLVMQEFMSLDGVVEDPGGQTEFEHGGWQRPFVDNDQIKHITAQAHAAQALVLGRKTYEEFVAAWPSRTGTNGLADRMNAMPKLVASTTTTSVEWESTLLEGDVTTALAEHKRRDEGDLLLVGSISLAQGLLRHDLVDELRIWVAPVVLGSGRRLFDETLGAIALTLVHVRTTSTGIAVLNYERNGG